MLVVGLLTLSVPSSVYSVNQDDKDSPFLSFAEVSQQQSVLQSHLEAPSPAADPLLLAVLSLQAAETETERKELIERIISLGLPQLTQPESTSSTSTSQTTSTTSSQTTSSQTTSSQTTSTTAVSLSNLRCQESASHPTFCVYTVQAGDTLSGIASKFGRRGSDLLSAVEMLAQSNRPDVASSDSILPGQYLRIPKQDGIIHTVLTSQTLSEIAASYGVTAAALAEANGVGASGTILIGQDLLIPNPTRLPFSGPTQQAPSARPSPTATITPSILTAVAEEEEEDETPSTRTPEPILASSEEEDDEDVAAVPTATAVAATATAVAATATPTATSTPRPRSTATATATPSPESTPESQVPVSAPAPTNPPASTTGFMWPTTGPISSYFGPAHPLGIDIDLYANPNAPIVASKAGKVTFAGGNTCCSYGLYVIIDHGDGYETLYAHFSQISVSQGQTVSQGQLLGYGGRTGYATGEHLHFEIRQNGTPVNPLNYLP